MSYHPARGRLREGTSGVDRSQAASCFWDIRSRQGDWSDLWLDVIMRRTATSDRRMVTAAKWVYSVWQFQKPGGIDGEALLGSGFTSQSVHMLLAVRKRQDVCESMAARRAAALCEEAAVDRRDSRGDHRQHAAVLRRCDLVRGAGVCS